MVETRTNENWLHELRAGGVTGDTAISDLRDLLLRAALFHFSRNLSDFEGLSRTEIMQKAEDCAQDALIAVMSHLEDFRGDSKFSTWAYKFAINIALSTARREKWKGASLDDLASSGEEELVNWVTRDKSDGDSPEQSALQEELRMIIRDVIEHDLSDRQKQVLLLMVFNEVPMDEVVALLDMNRNAVYKMLHDARRKIKQSLESHGFGVGETLELFSSQM